MIRVTIETCRELGRRQRQDGKTFCASGIRIWCDRHGIDYLELVRDGIDGDRIRGTDGWGDMLVDIAKEQASGEQ